MAIRRSQRRRRILIGLVVVGVIGAIVFFSLNIISLINERQTMKEQNEALLKEKAQLEKELSEINDPKNIEEQARDQLRLIKKGEYMYRLPEEITESDKKDETKEEE